MPVTDVLAVPVAVAELAMARLRLAKLPASELTAEVALGGDHAASSAQPLPAEVARVAFLIPRVAARLPWRADCLVQALAGRRWLARLGHGTTLSLGTRRSAGGQIEAHAWLAWQGQIVTGGDVSDYARFSRLDA